MKEVSSKLIRKILIANRGEIACRIIKTAKKLGIATVAVYSDPDSNAFHVELADEAVHIGAAASRESYLDIGKIIAAAKTTGADAIHPGYGFLSENSEFCQACKDSEILFIGPPVSAIEAMGSKSAAKFIMEKAGVSLVPGYHGKDQSRETLKKHAKKIGFPVLLKASAGGGGKGMRVVWAIAEFDDALDTAKREARNSFADDNMLVEKYLTQPRHIEFQIFCDQYGNAVHLFERDCSVQRRHQKIIEEAPAPGMSEELRQSMGNAAVRAAQAINYEGAGTVEFLLDTDDSFYFMEMNTRLQVEHPITEMITGQDLVEWQLRIAAGEPLPKTQKQLAISGHAFEARIYAEDPYKDFLPASGILSFLQPPASNRNVRVDSGVRQGDEVSIFYDPMIAKLIVWDENRSKALQRLSGALQEYRIAGLSTNIDFLLNISNHESFASADIDTGFIEKNQNSIFKQAKIVPEDIAPLAALYLIRKQQLLAERKATLNSAPFSPWNNSDSWRLNEAYTHQFCLEVEDKKTQMEIEQTGSGDHASFEVRTSNISIKIQGKLDGKLLNASLNGHHRCATIAEHDNSYSIFLEGRCANFRVITADLGESENESQKNTLNAPMNGTLVTLLVETDSEVKKNDALLVMEAMKMEHTIRAPEDGKVLEFYYQAGDLIDGGAELMKFEEK